MCELRLSGVYHCGISTYTFLERFWREPPRVGVDLGIANRVRLGFLCIPESNLFEIQAASSSDVNSDDNIPLSELAKAYVQKVSCSDDHDSDDPSDDQAAASGKSLRKHKRTRKSINGRT